MPSLSWKNLPFRKAPDDGLASSQSTEHTEQPLLVCTWSTHVAQSGQLPIPFPRDRHTATATAAGELFLFGGYERSCASSDLYVFSARDFSTTLLQTSGEVPDRRYAHGAALVGNTLLICGGKTKPGDQNLLNHDSFHLLDLVSKEWSRIAVNGPGPEGLSYNTTTVVGSRLFIFGGYSRIGRKYLNDMWTLDLNCLKSQPLWESYEPLPGNNKPPPRSGHVSVATEDRMIIFGGLDDQHYYNDTWLFDISTGKWTELQCTGSIPPPRDNHAAVLVDNVMYVFGGYCKISLDDLYALQLSTLRWFKLHNVGLAPHRRSCHAMSSDGTRVFVLGGYSSGARVEDISLIHEFDTKHIKYPDPEPNAQPVNPNEGTNPFAQKPSTGPSTQEQSEHPKFSLSETHGAYCMEKSTPAVSGSSASRQRRRGRNGWLLALKGLNCKPKHVPEDDVSEGSTVCDEKFAGPHSSSEGGNTKLELEEQVPVSLAVQTERDYQITRLTDELAKKSALLEQAEAARRVGTEPREYADELLVARDQQIGQYEKELANVRAKLEAKESELEAVRSRLASAENGLTKSKAEADTLRVQTATGSVDANEGQVARRVNAVE